MVEVWRTVHDFPAYEVSSEGRVRRSAPGRGARVGRVLRPATNPAGYREVSLWRDNRGRTRRVCQLVCEAFHGLRPEGMEVRHLDGNSQNDAASNLAWGTRSENIRDAVRHGTHNMTRKTHCKHGHEFTPENTQSRPNGGGRRCMTCRRADTQTYIARRRVRRAQAKAEGLGLRWGAEMFGGRSS